MFYFTIVRHGETKCNVAQIIQGRTDGELTEKGARMAQCLGKKLEDEKYTHIFSSDLKRCRDTTTNIVNQLKNPIPEIQYKSILQERDYGDWEFQSGQLCRDKRIEMGLPHHKHHLIDIPNGETYEHCKGRAQSFFQEILQLVPNSHKEHESQDKNLLVVSHGTLIASFIEYLIENSNLFELVNFNEQDFQIWPLNTAMTRFSILKVQSNPCDKFRLTFTNFYDAEHLHFLQNENSNSN